MKKILLTLMLGIFLISLASADLGFGKQGDIISVRGNLNASAVNVTIYFPNSTIAIYNQPMGNLRGDIWNYTFDNTQTLGKYIYDYCNQNGDNCQENIFEVTRSGRAAPNEGEGMIFLASILSMVLIALFFLVLSFTIDKENGLRFGFIAFSFVIFIMIFLYAFIALDEILPGFTNITDNFTTTHYVILAAISIIFILLLIDLIFKAVDSLKVKKGLKPPKEDR